jgi:hypothetical protein
VRAVGVMHRRSYDARIDFFVAAVRWAGQLTNAEPHKCDELRWASLDSLPDNVVPYVRRALANFRVGRWYDSYGFDESGVGM